MASIEPYLYGFTGVYTGDRVLYSGSYWLDDRCYDVKLYGEKRYWVSGPRPDVAITHLEAECRKRGIVPHPPRLVRNVFKGCVGHPVDVSDYCFATGAQPGRDRDGVMAILYALGGTVCVRTTGEYIISTREVGDPMEDFQTAIEASLTPPYSRPVKIEQPLARPVRR